MSLSRKNILFCSCTKRSSPHLVPDGRQRSGALPPVVLCGKLFWRDESERKRAFAVDFFKVNFLLLLRLSERLKGKKSPRRNLVFEVEPTTAFGQPRAFFSRAGHSHKRLVVWVRRDERGVSRGLGAGGERSLVRRSVID